MIIKKRAVFVLAVSMAALVACSSRMGADTLTCRPYVAITINLKPEVMAVSPKDRCATPGEDLVLRIIPPGQPDGTVRTIASESNPDGGGPRNWLSQPNVGDRIIVTVPGMPELREICPNFPEVPCPPFDYEVHADGKGEIDPRVTVRR